MNRAKRRKLLKTLPTHLPDDLRERALTVVHNGTARAQLRAAFEKRRAER